MEYSFIAICVFFIILFISYAFEKIKYRYLFSEYVRVMGELFQLRIENKKMEIRNKENS